jgi:hypothetical protein
MLGTAPINELRLSTIAPECVRDAALGEQYADRRVLKMLGVRGKKIWQEPR